MTDYKTHVDEETGITHVRVTGNIDLADQLQYMNSKSFDERTLRLVADVREASLKGLSRGALAKLLRTVKPLGKPGMRAAYVFKPGEDFSKGRLLLAQIETLGYEGRFKVFSNMEKAIAWVQQ